MRLSVECAFPYLRKRGAVSRKSALWGAGVTEKRTLGGWGHGKAQSGWEQSYRVRLSVTSRPQNASFRKVRFSLPAQTWSRLTGKRTLGGGLTEKRSLRFSDRANCAFPSHCRPRGVGRNHPPGCGAVCSRICKFGLEFDFTKRRSLGAQLG